MYVIEIETRNTLKKVKNPKKSRIRDMIFLDILQVMDNNEKWHTIWSGWIGVTRGKLIVDSINSAIHSQKDYIYLDI